MDEAAELADSAGEAPSGKSRKRKPSSAPSSGPEAEEPAEKAPKEPPTDEEKKNMRIRARVSGLRKHAAPWGSCPRASRRTASTTLRAASTG